MQNSITIVLSGEAGQGLQTIEDLLTKAISDSYYIFSASEVMSRVRGGNNTVTFRISEEKVFSFRYEIDFLFLLNDHGLSRLKQRITPNTRIFDQDRFAGEKSVSKDSNMVILGFIAGMLGLEKAMVINLIRSHFSAKAKERVSENERAFETGFDQGSAEPRLNLTKSSAPGTYKILDGTQAVGIGALSGGCNFVASYPMSPGTGLLTFMADHAIAHGVLVEQAEDEIAALNMVIGAWYAGARGLVTTSGGGFSLMQEAVSLAAMTETPCVIHVGQRPGPATGLPTRTEQADLNLVVYSGHGEFPRIVLAPGSLEDGVLLSQKAFDLADQYQVPVFILTDQFYLDAKGQMERLTLNEDGLKQHIIKTDPNYLRYTLNASGISPRGIPGYGTGFVKADSDEHDEHGMITEDFEMRVKMNDKRLRKENGLLEEYVSAELIGPSEYQHLIVGWGSTYGVLKEFIKTRTTADTAFLNIKQVYPLHSELLPYFKKAQSVTVVENNAKGQLADLLVLKLGVKITNRVLKYSGEPFFIEEIKKRLLEVL